MANITLTRVDYRMIHGQTVAKWMTFKPVDRLILVNEQLAKDEFMANIYKLAANGKHVDIIPSSKLDEVLASTNDKVMLIFKDVIDAYNQFKNGFNMTELNVGAVQSDKSKNRKDIVQGVAISKEEFDLLQEMVDKGVNVFFQPIPERAQTSFSSVINKFK